MVCPAFSSLPFRFSTIVAAAVGVSLLFLGGGCASAGGASSSSSEDERQQRYYEEGYRKTINSTARALADIGLNIDGTAGEGPNTYRIAAVRMARLGTGSEAIRVATVEVYIERRNRGTGVRVVTEKNTRTSTRGQSSDHMSDYARSLFDRLDDVLTPLAAPEPQAARQ